MRRTWLTIRYASFRNSSAVSVQGFLVWGIDEFCFESKLSRVGVRSVIVGVAWSEMCVVLLYCTLVDQHPTSLRGWSIPHPVFVCSWGTEYLEQRWDAECHSPVI
jgi:hypothetical protein